MKTIDEREIQKPTKKQTKAERSKGNRSYSESGKAKWFCCAFKLKQKNFFYAIEYDKMHPSGSAPARIYVTPKM